MASADHFRQVHDFIRQMGCMNVLPKFTHVENDYPWHWLKSCVQGVSRKLHAYWTKYGIEWTMFTILNVIFRKQGRSL